MRILGPIVLLSPAVMQAAIVENKRLGEVLAYIAARQEQGTEGRSKSAPRRQGQADRHMFKFS
jgi:hypothetical protein